MPQLLRKHWFFVGIAAVVALAYAAPAVGAWVREYAILKVGVFLAFAVSGLTLDTSSILRQMREARVLVAAIVSSLVLIPVIAYGLAVVVFPGSPDMVVGVCIIAAAPVTVASGTVMTAIARGNVPLSLFICVACNFVAVFTIPFTLGLLLRGGYDIHLSPVDTIIDLALTVLLPTLIGQLLRTRLKDVIKPYKKVFSIFQQSIVLLIIFNAVAGSSQRLIEAGGLVLGAFAFMIALRVVILAMNLGISKLIRLDAASTSAFTIHTSQKTLTVSYLVWESNFAALFPMALLPSIAYHLTQMIMDTFVAQAFLRRALAAEAAR